MCASLSHIKHRTTIAHAFGAANKTANETAHCAALTQSHPTAYRPTISTANRTANKTAFYTTNSPAFNAGFIG